MSMGVAFSGKLCLAETRRPKPNIFRAGSSGFREAEVEFGPRRLQVPQRFKQVPIGSMGIAVWESCVWLRPGAHNRTGSEQVPAGSSMFREADVLFGFHTL